MIPGINPNAELFRWGPIDMRPIYPDAWYEGMRRFAKRFVAWPTFFMHISKERVMFICETRALWDKGGENFRRFILIDSQFRKHYAEWERVLKKFLPFYRKITPEKLKKLSDNGLARLFGGFKEMYHDFWGIGLLHELANYGAEPILKKELQRIIKDEKEALHAFERLSAPEDYSFYQEEEIDVLKIKRLEQNKKKYETALKKHQRKFFWMLNSYHHTQILPVDYFRKELEALTPAQAAEKLKKIEETPKRARQEKKEIAKRYGLPKEVEKMAHRLAFCVWWQDQRKKRIFMANHCIDVFLDEITRRYGVDGRALHYYCIEDIAAVLANKKQIPENEIKERLQDFLRIYHDDTSTTTTHVGAEARALVKEYYTATVDQSRKEFLGLVVSKGSGNVRGTVRIIGSAAEISKMKQGDILVAPMTAPDYVVGMKKAAAIVTDEGGMTSHAAIVSRELGVPCIVGTKIATKVLKDGDRVEVDTNKGVVRKI